MNMLQDNEFMNPNPKKPGGMEIAIDLDGTLAEYKGWVSIKHIGAPIESIAKVVMDLHQGGFKIVIFTARANDPEAIPYIKEWLDEHGFPNFEITNIKRKEFIEIWDDRAISVERNTGFTMNANAPRSTKKPSESALESQVGGSHYKDMKIQPIEFAYANDLGAIEASVNKYICRHRFKNGVEDIDKAIHLLQLLKQLEYNQ